MQKIALKVRKASLSDAFAIAGICSNDLGYACEESLVRTRLSGIDPKRECVFVAQVENEVVGYVHIEKYETIYFETMTNVLGLAVSSQYQRNGAGKMLMAAAEEWSKEIGAKMVRLNSGATRTGAHEFYRSIGYDSEKKQIRFLKEL